MQRIYLNDDWYFKAQFTEDLCGPEADLSGTEKVRLPHTVRETPFHYFDESVYQMVSGYRREILIKDEWRGKPLLLTFEGAAHEARVFVNGVSAAVHYCGYTAFTVDLAPYLVPGEKQVVAVRLDSRESLDQPPFGHVIDYMTYGGIYRDVYLEVKNPCYIEDIYAATPDVLRDDKTLKVDVTLNEMAPDLELSMCLDTWTETAPEDPSLLQHWNFEPEKVRFKTSCLTEEVNEAYLWSTDYPFLYVLTVTLKQAGQAVDSRQVRIGFREISFEKEGFYLNGDLLKLRGLNRHQSWPYVGYAMPRAPQQLDADMLKYELGCNMVRTSHYPQSQHFIDRCDELGLLVFTEIPGWQHIGGTRWKKIAVRNVREMVTQYRNHPSIILWGVRINESVDDDAFYHKTNQLAHELDYYRQTGGVRYLKGSHLYEDVYTFNDFIHSGHNRAVTDRDKAAPSDSPYFISEFNGHMYPTKAFDDEAHRLEQALRYCRVLDAVEGSEDIAGCTGWCMFDYNTHQDFGSGDRVCYHGVMDMFRNPKLAAAVYKSQSDAEPVLEVSSSMNIGEYAASQMGDIYVFTNADSVRLYKNDLLIGEFYPDEDRFGSMPHPPVIIDDLIGDQLTEKEGLSEDAADRLKALFKEYTARGGELSPVAMARAAAFLKSRQLTFEEAAALCNKYMSTWGDSAISWRFEAVKDGQVTAVRVKGPAHERMLRITADRQTLCEETGYDVATIHIEAIDENGNRLPYYQEPVCFETEGAIGLIGPAMISLQGGCAGTYVRSLGRSGSGTLTVKDLYGEAKVAFTVELKG